MLKLTDELTLAIGMIKKNMPVPRKLEAKCLEQLELMIMNYEDGDAMYYILDLMITAIKEQSIEVLGDVADLGAELLMTRSIEKNTTSPKAKELAMISYQAAEDWLGEGEEDMKHAILMQLANEYILPVYYKNQFFLFYMKGNESFVASSINGSYDKDTLKSLVETMPTNEKTTIFQLIHDLTGKANIQIKFGNLKYIKYADDQMLLEFEEI